MSFALSSPSRYSNWAVMRLAMWSFTSVPRNTMRFFSRRLKTSRLGSTSVVCDVGVNRSGRSMAGRVAVRRGRLTRGTYPLALAGVAQPGRGTRFRSAPVRVRIPPPAHLLRHTSADGSSALQQQGQRPERPAAVGYGVLVLVHLRERAPVA